MLKGTVSMIRNYSRINRKEPGYNTIIYKVTHNVQNICIYTVVILSTFIPGC